jgi:hypothetical protein
VGSEDDATGKGDYSPRQGIKIIPTRFNPQATDIEARLGRSVHGRRTVDLEPGADKGHTKRASGPGLFMVKNDDHMPRLMEELLGAAKTSAILPS